jgi:UDP-N-acetylmuramoyl-tripeptide--D-alanyl-D-alanine ligase
MAELGASSEAEHRAVARMAEELGIEVMAVATNEYGLPAVAGPDEVVSRLRDVGPGTAVLVKASRVAALERVALGLRDG